jgi:redox-sensitive bicupin YhaK (pirin superfamily)
MLTIRPASERGHANHGWLDSKFSFSFSEYYDPKHMGFRALRVINEDVVAPQMGFGKHPHRDMEILSYVLEGAVQHEDSMGSSEILRPGELQHMSAGSGVRHSERNPSATQPFHMLQIWLLPNALGIEPAYEQKAFGVQTEPDKLHLLASKDGREGSFVLHSDAELSAARLTAGGSVEHRFHGQYGWLQAARGTVHVGGKALQAGDGLRIEGEASLRVESEGGGEFLLFDLD